MDLANNFKDEYRTLVYDDLNFFEQISDGYGLAQRAETNELRAIRYSPIETFENVLKEEIEILNYLYLCQKCNRCILI